jgi:hypothetical protein
MQIDIFNTDEPHTWLAPQQPARQALAVSGGAATWDLSRVEVASITLAADTTLTLANPGGDGANYELVVYPNGHALTIAGVGKWLNGSVYAASPAAGAVDEVDLSIKGATVCGAWGAYS